MDSSFRVNGRSDRFEPDDPAWLDQYAELVGTMTHFGVPVGRESDTGAVHKGALETIVVADGSADCVRACAEAWRAWLGRDGTRWIELTHSVGGAEKFLVLRSADLADGRFDRMVDEFAGRFPAT
jgi:hypothetical protein